MAINKRRENARWPGGAHCRDSARGKPSDPPHVVVPFVETVMLGTATARGEDMLLGQQAHKGGQE